MSNPVVSTYRATLREIRRQSVAPRSKRPSVLADHLRSHYTAHRGLDLATAEGARKAEALRKDAENLLTFLRSKRLHQELLERYNPLHSQTPEERIAATARRVGLNVPREYKGDATKE